MNNAMLRSKPFYITHREVDGAPVAADSSDMAVLLAANPRSCCDCAGYKTVKVFVRLTGGAAPTVVLQPIESIELPDATRMLAITGSNTAALASGDCAEITINGGFLFVRLNTIANNPTKVEIFVAGSETLPSMPGGGR